MRVNKKAIVCSMLDSGMNNIQLSKASGVSVARISNIKNGNNTTYETVSKLARALKVSVTDLIEDPADLIGQHKDINGNRVETAAFFPNRTETSAGAHEVETAVITPQAEASHGAII